jgi:hypothetical protein
MPDQEQPSDGNNPDSLEALFQEAEQQATTPVVDHPKPCLHTFDESTHLKCPTCLWSFCSLCASSLDPRYCNLCLSDPATELIQEPLIDKDGVQHEGRVLHPAPTASFFFPRLDLPCNTLLKTLSEMTIPEEEEYVKQYKDLVRQAELQLDRRRVVLGAAQLDLEQKKSNEQRKLRSDKNKYPIRTVSIDKKTGKQVTRQASMTQLADALRALEQLQALKKRPSQTPTVVQPEQRQEPEVSG